MATANMRHFNSPEEIAKRESGPVAPAQRGQGFRHFNSPSEVARREGRPVPAAAAPPVVPARARQVVDVQPEPEPQTALALLEQPRPQAGPLSADDPLERIAQLERFVYALLDDPREAREWRLQLHNIGATVEAQGLLANKVRAVEQTCDQLVTAQNEGGGVLGRLRALETALDTLAAPQPQALAQAPADATTAPATPPATPPAT